MRLEFGAGRWVRRPVAALVMSASLVAVSACGSSGVHNVGAAIGTPGPAQAAPAATALPEGLTLEGDLATAVNARVVAVVAGKGFWVSVGGRRVWVELTGEPATPRTAVKVGDVVSFAGRLTRDSAGLVKRISVAAKTLHLGGR